MRFLDSVVAYFYCPPCMSGDRHVEADILPVLQNADRLWHSTNVNLHRYEVSGRLCNTALNASLTSSRDNDPK